MRRNGFLRLLVGVLVIGAILLFVVPGAIDYAALPWVNDQMEQEKQDVTQRLSTNLRLVSLQCNAVTDTAQLYLKNGGKTTVSLNHVDVYLRDATTDKLIRHASPNWQNAAFKEPGKGEMVSISLPMESGKLYSITVEFDNGYTVSERCTAS